MKRKTFIDYLIKAGGVGLAGLLGIPALLSTLTPNLKRRRYPNWHSLGPLQSFEVGGMKPAVLKETDRNLVGGRLKPKGVYVWRPKQNEIIVFSRTCTDLGCPVMFDPGSELFLCPCHGGIFSKSGEPMAGPPKRPLWKYESRIRNSNLEINTRSVPAVV